MCNFFRNTHCIFEKTCYDNCSKERNNPSPNRTEGGTNMAYTITDNCVKCGTCADTCPLGIITEGEDKYVIDAEQCVECGSCAAACPVEAIEL